MSVVSEISVTVGDFKLGRTLSDYSNARIYLERIVPLGERTIPYLWIETDEDVIDDVLKSLRAELDVEAVEPIATEGDRTLVRIEWADDPDVLLDTIVEVGGTVLDGLAAGDRWQLTLRFDDQEDLSTFYRTCADAGVSITVESIQNPGPSRVPARRPQLTDAQSEILRAAYETGYFEVPRGATTNDLADRFGVSDTAISQRIRRAMQRLVEEAVIDHDADRP
ncbi:MAG TPA: helix-turn-helix domain-containing protein [Natrialbaceae archaeon]|nr:helix-turn-helix domain-containing protein [Natrialbaceae archaeon]